MIDYLFSITENISHLMCTYNQMFIKYTNKITRDILKKKKTVF